MAGTSPAMTKEFMDDLTAADPREEIAELEERIEELAAKLEGCRKFALAARVAMALGAAVLIAIVVGALRPDPTFLIGGIGAVLGGIVLWGSNSTTAQQAAAQMAQAEAERRALIGAIGLRLVSDAPTLH
jgi:cell division protein FtsX